MRSRQPLRNAAVSHASCALALALLAPAEPARSQAVEVIRGSQVERVVVGDGSRRTLPSQGAQGGDSGGSADIETQQYMLSASQRHAIHSDVESMIDIYRNELGLSVDPDFAVRLEFLGSSGDFERKAGGSRSLRGFYRHATREAVVSGDGGWDRVHETALHESSHAILMDQIPSIPPWLNEGLAEYFEGLQHSYGAARVEDHPGRLSTIGWIVEAGSTGSLEDFLGLSQGHWAYMSNSTAAMAYLEGWSLAAFLMDTNRAALRDILAAHQEQGSSATSVAVIEQHYAGGVRGLERDWRRWLKESR